MDNEVYTVQLIEDENGELVLPIPDGIMEAMDLVVGDTIELYYDEFSGDVTLTKYSEDYDEDEDEEIDEEDE